MVKVRALPIILFWIVILSSCSSQDKLPAPVSTENQSTPVFQTKSAPSTIKDIPVSIGDVPPNSENDIPGSWQADRFLVGSDGRISGNIRLTLKPDRHFTPSPYQDVLIIQVFGMYIWPQFGDILQKPAGDFIPIKASQANGTSAVFNIEEKFSVPTLKIDTDNGMPLSNLQIRMVWFRVNQVSADSFSGFAALFSAPDTFLEHPMYQGKIVDQTVNLNGVLDTRVGGDTTSKYHAWFQENIPLHDSPTMPYPVPTSPKSSYPVP